MKENAMRHFGVFLASAALGVALVAGGPALARGGFGGGGFHGGGFGGAHFGGFGGGRFGGPMLAGRSVAVGGFNRGFGFNHGFNSRFARFDHFHHFHHFRNRFAFFPGFVGGGWDWGYPYYDYAVYGNGCWRQVWTPYGWQWSNICYNYGDNYGY
jgi:hypothetical protein